MTPSLLFSSLGSFLVFWFILFWLRWQRRWRAFIVTYLLCVYMCVLFFSWGVKGGVHEVLPEFTTVTIYASQSCGLPSFCSIYRINNTTVTFSFITIHSRKAMGITITCRCGLNSAAMRSYNIGVRVEQCVCACSTNKVSP